MSMSISSTPVAASTRSIARSIRRGASRFWEGSASIESTNAVISSNVVSTRGCRRSSRASTSIPAPKSEAQTQNRFSLVKVGCWGSGNLSSGNIVVQLSTAEELPGPSSAPHSGTSWATHSTTAAATTPNRASAVRMMPRPTLRTSTTRATSTRSTAMWSR